MGFTLYHVDRSVVSNTLWELSAALQRVCELLRVILRLPPHLCDRVYLFVYIVLCKEACRYQEICRSSVNGHQ